MRTHAEILCRMRKGGERGSPPDQLGYSIGSGAKLQKLLRFSNDMLVTKIALNAIFVTCSVPQQKCASVPWDDIIISTLSTFLWFVLQTIF